MIETQVKHILTRNSLLNCQVCSEGSWDEALDWVRQTNPAGTQKNWSKDERPEVAPVRCEKFPERTHYVFTC